MFQITKQIRILDKGNQSKYKYSFEMMISLIEGKMLSTPTWPHVQK